MAVAALSILLLFLLLLNYINDMLLYFHNPTQYSEEDDTNYVGLGLVAYFHYINVCIKNQSLHL